MSHNLLKGYPIALTQAVIWGDLDAFDHVNNTVYFRYFEDARMAFFEKSGVIRYKDLTHVGPILATTSCDFKLPLKYPDTVHIGGRARVLSEKKIMMDYLVVSDSLDAIVAEGQGLLVYYDYKAGRSCAIPDAVLGEIECLDS